MTDSDESWLNITVKGDETMREFKAVFTLIYLLLIPLAVPADDEPQLVLPIGHISAITAVAFSPDGRYVLSGSVDRTMRLWEVATGREVRTFPGHFGAVISIAISPDGRYILSSHMSKDNSLRLWALDTGQYLRAFSGHTDTVYTIAFSPYGQEALSGSGDKTLKLWNVSTGHEIRSFSGHKHSVNSVTFSPDGVYALSGSSDRTVCLWDVSTGRQVRSLSLIRNKSAIYSVAFSPDGKYALAEINGAALKLWSVANGREVRSFSGNTGGVRSVAFSPDGMYALAGCNDKTMKLWEVATGRKVCALSKHTAAISSVAFSPDGHYALSGSWDRTMRLYDVTTGREIRSFSGHTNISKFVAISPDGRFVLSGFENSALKLWNLPTGHEVHNFLGHKGAVTSVAFSPNGKYALSGSYDKTLKLWNMSTFKEIRSFSGHLSRHRGAVTSIEFSPDSRYALSGSEDKTLKLWEVNSGRNLRTFSGHTDAVTSVAFSPDGLHAISGSKDGAIKLWDISNGRNIQNLSGNPTGVLSIAFSPDGRHILAGSHDPKLRLWDISKSSAVRASAEVSDSGWIVSVAFNKDGRYALSSSDWAVKLWSVSDGQIQLIRSLRNTGTNYSIVFSPDKRYVVGCCADMSMKVWNLATEELLFTRLQLDETDWVVVTPDGRFDGSPDGIKLLHYAKDSKSIPLDALFDRFYTPNLVVQVLSGEELAPGAPDIREGIEIPPLVRILSPEAGEILSERTVDVVVQAVDQGGGAEDIRLYHNGKRIGGEEKAMIVRPSAGAQRTFTVSLVNGTNILRATAYSRDRTEAHPFEVSIEVKIAEATADLYIVAVGINKYENSSYNLNYAVKDAQDVSRLLEKCGKGIFGPAHIQTVFDEQATRSGIEAAFKRVEQEAGPEDVFVFFYSGHGVMNEREPIDFYLVSADMTQMYGNDAGLAEKGIPAAQLRDSCQRIEARKQLLILDACQAGGMVDAFTMRGAVEEKAIAQLARSAGVVVLASTETEQLASEVKELGHGLFTYALLKGMEGEADGSPKDGKVTVYELKSYIDDRIPDLSQRYRGQTQYPTAYSYGQDFPLLVPGK